MEKIDTSDDLQRGAVAGAIASAAFLAGMFIDLAVTRQRTNDLRLLGELPPIARRAWPLTGTIAHMVNGTALGAVFGWSYSRLPGPGWLRGLIFGQVENLLLWPFIMVIDKIHPSIRKGALDRYNRPGPFLAEVYRHAIYGVVLGVAFDRLGRKNEQRLAFSETTRHSEQTRST
jgi:hypothetical protein